MPEIIFDNCVLSNFTLSDSLVILKNLYTKTSYVTNFVIAENNKGVLKGYNGLSKLNDAVKEGWIKEIVLKSKKEKALFETLSVSVGWGEASSISAAKVKGFIFACDDRVARREAELLGIKLTGTLGILSKAIGKRVIDNKMANIILTRMIKFGFYSPVKSIKDIRE